ncbi:hypothetical protein [uncultured Erythrobacter sp.]|uniref:hypothetical protein n=1 Tax=uncultured Erythrobacter sp. TaxID=263913 RepID=UPI00261892CE|nr:hypothetical protein [uncultured Erythrobacter sp.]
MSAQSENPPIPRTENPTAQEIEEIMAQVSEVNARREQEMQSAAILVGGIFVALAVLVSLFATARIARITGANWKAVLITAMIPAILYFVLIALTFTFWDDVPPTKIFERFMDARWQAWAILFAMVVGSALTAWARIALLKRKARKAQGSEMQVFS